MDDEKPDEGDTVSWNWGSGRPSGTVAETKDHGHIAIKSKRGNTIKKNASPDDPAVHISRPGNDVVKRASELTVDEKGSDVTATCKNEKPSKRKAGSQDVEQDSDGVEGDDDGDGEGDGKDDEDGAHDSDDAEAASQDANVDVDADSEDEGARRSDHGKTAGSRPTEKRSHQGKAATSKKQKTAPSAGKDEEASAPKSYKVKKSTARKPPATRKKASSEKSESASGSEPRRTTRSTAGNG